MADSRYPTELAAELAPDALERLLRYVRIDTQADEASTTYPSTQKQLELSRLLAEELAELGLDDAHVEEGSGYVFATLPATGDGEGAPTLGLIAHVDTSPDVSGAGVQPQVVEAYGGGDIPLPGAPGEVLSPGQSPLLAERVGHDIVTTDGTTLLGADDKAGVAEIMAAVAYLVRHPELPRARTRIAFTVDEEVGRGTERFDIERFGAAFAYTFDGARVGEIENETFTAHEAVVTFRGRSAHPGTAKGKLVNAVKLASEFVERLPKDSLSPETTEGREGFVHPRLIEGSAERARVVFIVRDFESDLVEQHEQLLRELAGEVVAGIEGAGVEISVREQYRNMREVLEQHPRVLAAAEEAARRVGLEPRTGSIRGGTDGSMLTAKGLPTPNIFTGGNEYHSVREWISVQDMATSAAAAVELVRLWAEPEWRNGEGGG
ncbi:MAG: tripeptide aminopeptidase [Gaiellaceae bacterium]|nr:tripeptide aminopeptidase [Gaiellaceae bacterium]